MTAAGKIDVNHRSSRHLLKPTAVTFIHSTVLTFSFKVNPGAVVLTALPVPTSIDGSFVQAPEKLINPTLVQRLPSRLKFINALAGIKSTPFNSAKYAIKTH